MLAIQVSQVGGPEVLRLVDVPVPTPQPGEAIVQIEAAGIISSMSIFEKDAIQRRSLSLMDRRPQESLAQLAAR